MKTRKIKIKNINAKIKSINDLKEISPVIQPKDRQIEDLIRDKRLEIQPFFQRNYVWSDKKASQLVESIILNLPIPEVYSFIDPETDQEMIIDGQQRLTAALDFVKDKYKLCGLKTLGFLNGSSFYELPTDYRSKIERYSFRINRIENIDDRKVIFEIFRRFNSGSVSLTHQEIRNCIYNGEYNFLIQELSTYSPFKKLISKKIGVSRMEESELVLRFFAFEQSLSKYSGKYHMFLNDFMEKEATVFENYDSEKLKQEKENLCKLFKKSVDITIQVFGPNSFKTCYLREDKNGNLKLNWGMISKSIFDLMMIGFVDYEMRDVIEHKDSIREAFIDILTNGDDFLPSSNINGKKSLISRISKWRNELQQIIPYKNEPRTFSYALKQELFVKNNKTCFKCGQRIESIEDAQIDHHKPYWQGGETIPENARLMHRFCNQSKNGY